MCLLVEIPQRTNRKNQPIDTYHKSVLKSTKEINNPYRERTREEIICTKERYFMYFLEIITIRIKGTLINYVTIVKHINLLPLTAAFNLKVKTYNITPLKDCTNCLLL